MAVVQTLMELDDDMDNFLDREEFRKASDLCGMRCCMRLGKRTLGDGIGASIFLEDVDT